MGKYDFSSQEFDALVNAPPAFIEEEEEQEERTNKYNLTKEEFASIPSGQETATRFDPSKYDKGYVPAKGDIGLHRATNQPWNHQASRAVVGGLMTGALTFVEDASYIADIENGITRWQGLETMESNKLAELAKEAKETVNRDWLPIYRNNPNQVFDWGDSGFYWEALRGIVDSAVGFGGVGLGAAGLVRGAAKLGGKALRAARVSKYVQFLDEAVGAANLENKSVSSISSLFQIGGKASQAGQAFAAGYITNFGEGKMMALELYDEAKTNLMDANPYMSEERASELAGEQADTFIMRNKAMMFSDAFALSGIARTVGRGRNLLKQRNLKTFGKNLLKFERTNPLAQASAEALEEIYQNTIQQEGVYQARKKAGQYVGDIPVDPISRAYEFATSDKALLEGMMGFFGGPVQYGIMQHPFTMADNKAHKEQYQRQQDQVDTNRAYLENEFAKQVQTQTAKSIAAENGEDEVVEQIDEETFNSVVVQNYQNGTLESLENQIKDIIADDSEEALEKYGEGYQEKMQAYLDKISNVESEFLTLEKKYQNPIYAPVIPIIYKLKKSKELLTKQLTKQQAVVTTLREQVIAEHNTSKDQALSSAAVEMQNIISKRVAINNVLDKLTVKYEAETGRNANIKRAKKLGITDDRKSTSTREIGRVNKIIKSFQQTIQTLNAKEKEIRDGLKEYDKAEADEEFIVNSELAQEYTEAQEAAIITEVMRRANEEKLKEYTDYETVKKTLDKHKKAVEDKIKEDKKKADKIIADKKKKEYNAKQEKKNPPKVQTDTELKDVKSPSPEDIMNSISNNDIPSDVKLFGEDSGVPKSTDKKEIPSEDQHGNEYTDKTDKDAKEEIKDVGDELYRKNNKNEIAPEKNLEEDEEDNVGKLAFTNSAIAYVSKDAVKTELISKNRVRTIYTEKNNELSSDLKDNNLLASDSYLAGTEVSISIDYDYAVGEETYETLLAQGDEANPHDYIPIAISKDNKIIGYIHNVAYPEQHTWTKNIEADIATIRATRKAIVEQLEKTSEPLKTVVTEKTVGHLAFMKDGEAMLLKDATADPHPVIAISTGRGIRSNKGDIDLAIELKLGLPYIMTRASNGEVLPLPIRSTKLSSAHKKSIMNAFKAHIQNNAVGDLKLNTTEGLLNYLRQFTSDTIPSAGFEHQLDKYLSDQSSAIGGINITPTALDIGIGKGVAYISSRPKKDTGERIYTSTIAGAIANEEKFFSVLNEVLDRMYYHVNVENFANEEEFKPAIIDDNFETTTENYGSYTEFLKGVYESNVLGFDLGNDKYTYTVQPNIFIDLQRFLSKEEKTGGLELQQEQETGKPKSVEIDGITIGLSSEKNIEEFDSDDALVQKLNKLYYETNLVGPTPTQQSNLIGALAGLITRNMIGEGETTMTEQLTYVKNFLTKVKGIFEENEIGYLIERTDNVLIQWDKMETLIFRRLQQVQGIKFFEEEGDHEGYNEKIDYSKTSLEIDTRDTASARLRHFLASINEVTEVGAVDTSNTYINLGKNIEYDVAFADLKAILTETKPSYELYIKKLKESVSGRPYLSQVIDKLEKADTDLKNEFVMNMTSHPAKARILQLVDNKGSLEGRVILAARNSIGQVIQEEWEANLMALPTVSIKEEGHYIKEEDAKSLLAEWDKLPLDITNETLTDSIQQYSNWLQKLGVTVNDELINSLIWDKKKLIKARNIKTGVFGAMAGALMGRRETTLENSPILGQTAVRRLAKWESSYRPDVHNTSYKNAEKKTVSTYAINKYLTDRVLRFNTNDNHLIEKLRDLPYSSTSKWLELLMDETSAMGEVFDYFYVDALRKEDEKKGTILDELNETDLEIAKLNFLFNRGTTINYKKGQGDERIGYLLFLTTSNKKTVTGLSSVLHTTDVNMGTETIDALFNALVLPEIKRIHEFQDKGDIINIEGFTEGSKKFWLIPELQGKDFDYLRYEDSSLKPMSELEENKSLDKIKEFIKDTYIPGLVDKRIQSWNKLGLISNDALTNIDSKYHKYANSKVGTNATEEQITRYIALDYETNYLIANSNMTQMFSGDPAFFFRGPKETVQESAMALYNNMGKRLAREIAPGSSLANSWDEDYKQGLVADHFADSLNKELIKADERYGNISATDAQEFTTFDEHLKVMHGLGRLSLRRMEELKKRNKSETLTKEDLGFVLQPMKPVYSDNLFSKNLQLERPIYIKSSSFPLISQLTKNLEVDKLRIAMEKQGVDRVAFATAVKVGNTNSKLQIFNDDGTVKDDIKFTEDNTLILNRRGFRIQQDIPYSASKKDIIDGTQQIKLLFDSIKHIEGMTEQEERFNDRYKEWYDIRRASIRRLFTDKNGDLDITLAKAILEEEALRRGYNTNDLEILKLPDKEFKKFLFFTDSSSRMEALLNSIVDKKARKTTMPGMSGILGTEEGFRFKDSIVAEEEIVEETVEETETIRDDEKIKEAKVGLEEKKQETTDRYSKNKQTIQTKPIVSKLASIDSALLKDKKVTWEVERGDTIELEEVDATEANTDLKSQIKQLEKLIDCVNSK